MENDIIQRNGKDYVKVKGVKVKITEENYSIDLYSKKLSRLSNGFLNVILNYCFCFDPDFENYIAFVVNLLVELFFEKMAVQDIFHHNK